VAFASLGAVASGLAFAGTLGNGSTAGSVWRAATGGDYAITPRMVSTGSGPRFVGGERRQ
jgi:hypothetical protein